MKIRGKLLTLILVPLLAACTAAAWGFRGQSVKVEEAEATLELAEASTATHRVIIAYGNERLALFSLPGTNEIDELRAETDAAVAAAGLTSDLLIAARAENNRTAAAALYSDAIDMLLSASAATQAYETDQLLTSVAAHTTFELLEAREMAWFDYIDVAETGDAEASLVPVAVSLSEATALAEETDEFIDMQDEPTLIEASQSDAEQTMDNLAFLATNEMASGQTNIAPADIVDSLVEARTEWNGALVASDSFVVADINETIAAANSSRSLFALLGGGGLLVLGSLVFVVYRSITRPLANLLGRARSVANDELPALVLGLGGDADVDDLPGPALIPVSTNDEIGQLVGAFNDVHCTAHDLATEAALGRRNVAEMFVNLGRRNQQLLERILGLLTDLEREEEDPETLRDLFVLDNVVTRMRRNAESLLVLAGGQTVRQWSNPVSLEDTVRSALSEVEGYERVDIAALAEVRVPGNTVADIAHLLAELIENAVSFSDPSTQVLVSGHFEDDGYVVTIFDQGIGMSDEELEKSNRRISDPPPLDKAPTRFLGLFVVGRLAERHGVTVRLQKAPGRGVMSRVLLPKSALVVDDGVDTNPAPSDADQEWLAAPDELVELDPGAHGFIDVGIEEVGEDAAPVSSEPQDLDEVLAEVGTDEVIAVEPLDAEPLPTRSRPVDHVDEPVEESLEVPEPLDELPTRVRGDALNDASNDTLGDDEVDESPMQPEHREAIGEEAAGSFSSMMSAFSSGVNRGLEDTAFDLLDDGNDQ